MITQLPQGVSEAVLTTVVIQPMIGKLGGGRVWFIRGVRHFSPVGKFALVVAESFNVSVEKKKNKIKRQSSQSSNNQSGFISEMTILSRIN